MIILGEEIIQCPENLMRGRHVDEIISFIEGGDRESVGERSRWWWGGGEDLVYIGRWGCRLCHFG